MSREKPFTGKREAVPLRRCRGSRRAKQPLAGVIAAYFCLA